MTEVAVERKLVKSAMRVIEVLELFDQEQRPMQVAEVAEHYGWPASSTSALMRTLVSLGYLEYDTGKRVYRPSVRVALLGDWVQGSLTRDGQLARLLEHINQQTGETVVLAQQNGLHSQYLRVLQGTNALRHHIGIGTLRPLFASGTGRMLLCSMEEPTVRKLVRRHNATSSAGKRVDIDEVLDQVEKDRARGYALSLNQFVEHSGLIAMTLPFAPGERPLALGISGLTMRLQENEQAYVKLMRQSIRDFLTPEPARTP